MAVAELPSRAIVLPRPAGRPSTRSENTVYAAWILLVGILVGIASLFYLAQTSVVASTGYGIQELQVQESNWEMRNEQLSLELDKARALSVIATQATGRLLMVPARNPIYLKTAPADGGLRSSPTSGGDSRVLPALGKTVTSTGDPLDPVGSSLSLLLAPRSQPLQR